MRWIRNHAVAIQAVLPRAFLLWALVRLVFVALGLSARIVDGSLAPPPAAIVLLSGLVGVIDIHRRGERVLWANLGSGLPALFAVHCAAAIVAEIGLALVSR